MEKTEKSTFKKLSGIDISSRTEKKGQHDYLSWANAWSIVKFHYPDALRKVYESDIGLNFFSDGSTAYVKVGVEINGLEHIDYLPVMDFRNKSITVDKITSMDVNNAIQRSTTKAIAMHGLGIKLWIGEDLVKRADARTQPKYVISKNK